LEGIPLLGREGEVRAGTRRLDLRRGLLLTNWTHRTPAGVTFEGRKLRLLSLADRAVGLQLLQFSLDRDDVDVEVEAIFALAGRGDLSPVGVREGHAACDGGGEQDDSQEVELLLQTAIQKHDPRSSDGTAGADGNTRPGL
jgi:hypothetical protein